MPFTLAHPAAVVPLRHRLGRFGSVSALSIGSMIPDLPYFLPIGVSGIESHSVLGLAWFCLPAGIIAWVAYGLLLRPFVIALCPSAVERRMSPAGATFRAGVLVATGVSVIFGAATHIVWDSFTHRFGAVVQAFPALAIPIHVVGSYTPRLYTLLQHASTIVGLSVLACSCFRWYRRISPAQSADPPLLPVWSRSVILMMLVAPSMVAGLLVLGPPLWAGGSSFQVLQLTAGRAVFSAGRVFLMILLPTALAWRFASQSRLLR